MTTIDDLPPSTFAGVPRRLVAACIDVPIWTVGVFVTLFLLGLANGGELQGDGPPVLLFLALWTLLWEGLWTAGGGTPGKRIAGFSVRRLDGSRLSVMRSLVRTVLKYAQFYMFILVVVSMVLIARSARAQALHDLAVGSACFEREALELLRSPQAHTPAPATTSLPTSAPSPSPSSPADDTGHRGPFL